MKNFTITFLFLLFINLAVPALYYKTSGYTAGFSDMPENGYTSDNISETGTENVILYDKSAGKNISVPLTEYLANAAACEMPAVYEEEAIKAQMVAIHSYYLYCRDNPGKLENGHITVDSRNMKGYTDKAKLNQFWGSKYYDYYAKFTRCAQAVADYVLTHNGETALTPYYAVSCGKTAASEEIWGEKIDYLCSVDSSADGASDDFLEIRNFTKEEMYARIKSTFPMVKIKENQPEEWFSDIIYHPSGYAKYIVCGKDKIPGDQFRDALGLKSSCVLVFWEDDTFSIATKGYGHGVGMSQYGANQLSQQGSKYPDILRHYYPGTELKML